MRGEVGIGLWMAELEYQEHKVIVDMSSEFSDCDGVTS